MNIGVFLSPGDSLLKQSLSGQDERFIEYYLKPYARSFKRVFIFSYGDDACKKKLPENVLVLTNKHRISYFFYQFLFPFFYLKEIKSCRVIRVMQAAGGLPAVISRVLFNKKYFVTYGYDYARFAFIEKKYLRSALLSLIVPLVLFFAHKVIVTRKTNLKKSVYIPNGADIGKFSVQKLSFKARIIKILSVGRLTVSKNHQLLIKSVSGINNKNVFVTIVGSGSQKNNLLKLAKQNKVNLKIVRPVKYSQLVKYYHRADIFCLPSLVEGQSKVLLEAMACGLPIVVRDIRENREVVCQGKNGLLFSGESDLASKMNWLIKNPAKARRQGKAARAYVLKNHDLVKLVGKEIKMIRNA